jgi:hypothetical protein
VLASRASARLPGLPIEHGQRVYSFLCVIAL